MRKLLISLGGVDYGDGCAGSWAMNSLTAGGLVCLESGGADDGLTVDGVAPTPVGPNVYFAIGPATGETVTMSAPVNRLSLKYEKVTYSAAAARINYLGDDGVLTAFDLNLPTVATGNVARVRITDLNKPEWDNSRETVIEQVATAADTNATLTTKLTAALNAGYTDVTFAEVGAGANKGIKGTADTAGKNWAMKGEGVLVDAAILTYKNKDGTYTAGYTTPTNNSDGNGTVAQLLEVEKMFLTQDGKLGGNLLAADLWAVSSKVVAGATYTCYTLTWTMPDDDKITNEPNMLETLIIAIPSGETGAAESITAMDNILAVL